jgi:ferric-dicitrate binding protein FerR (iron transport regulator)
VHFGGMEKRTVFLESGEAYFKVKHNVEQPFIVSANGVDIRVTGTEFNVNTYAKNIATTLAHGSVQVSAGAKVTMLQPGQQAVYTGSEITRKEVDVDTYTAWKDGQIIFEETTLEDVMNSLGRQYDFTVEFTTPGLKERKFGGSFRKTGQVEDILTAIGKAGNIQFSIRNRTVFISPATTK